MGCLGVHFALTEDEVLTLRAIDDERARLAHIQNVIEEEYFSNQQEFLAESDKSWDAMHRVLGDGDLTWDGGKYPLNHVVLAGELLYTRSDYIISLKTPQQVKDIAGALPTVTKEMFRERYFGISSCSYGMELSEVDFDYTWDYFQSVREFYLLAAENGRFVLFTASQ